MSLRREVVGDQSPDLEWHNDVPVSTQFDDPYFSFADGLAETRHVFLAGNGLPERFHSHFEIAELGFGTGLNCFAALVAWRESGKEGQLGFTSFEKYPLDASAMHRALEVYPDIAALAEPVLEALELTADEMTANVEGLRLRVMLGDARETLPKWSGSADAWFLDGFSPAKNPELWEEDLLKEVAAHTNKGGTAATYSAAGHVRRGLKAAGFTVERREGYGRKRHMTVARLT